ncbi:MAG: hypothetical protein H6742_19260 [Alphaproteobacteria bacterium]|nr:hypothetical protein [Alphaproteobacteria bacterium]
MSRPAADEVPLPEDVATLLRDGTPFPARPHLEALDPDTEGLPPALRLLLRRGLPAPATRRLRPLLIGGAVGGTVGALMDIVRTDDTVPLWVAVGLGAAAGASAATLWRAGRERSAPVGADHPVDLALARPATAAERALGEVAFVLWHDGRYWLNVDLPARVVVTWSLRADQGMARLEDRLAELQAGASMLTELSAAAADARAPAAALDDELHRWRALRPELARIGRELRHAAGQLADEAHRRRRPHPEGGTEVVWSLDLRRVLDEVRGYAGVVGF